MITPRLKAIMRECIAAGEGVEAVLCRIQEAAKQYGNRLEFEDAIEVAHEVEEA